MSAARIAPTSSSIVVGAGGNGDAPQMGSVIVRVVAAEPRWTPITSAPVAPVTAAILTTPIVPEGKGRNAAAASTSVPPFAMPRCNRAAALLVEAFRKWIDEFGPFVPLVNVMLVALLVCVTGPPAAVVIAAASCGAMAAIVLFCA